MPLSDPVFCGSGRVFVKNRMSSPPLLESAEANAPAVFLTLFFVLQIIQTSVILYIFSQLY